MKSKLFEERPKTTQTGTDRWVRILPDTGQGYRLYDAMEERYLGRILVDDNGNWIYDGEVLTITEQEDLAGEITGNHKEMNDLIGSLPF